MKKQILTVLALISLFIIDDVEAIGGRGGGGARAGGARGVSAGARGQGVRPQQYASIPSPSMSRADIGSRQSLYSAGQQMPRQTAQNLRSNLPQLNQMNGRTAAQVTQQFRQQHPNANNLLNNRFNSLYYGTDANLWRNAGWAATAGWIGLNSDPYGYPAYYYDTNGMPAYLPPQETVIYAPQNVTVPQSAQAPVMNQPASTNEAQSLAAGEWLPLGVYALSSSVGDASDSNMVLQLSVNKKGFLSGTYYNAATDKSYPMEGQVNKDSQEAIWKLSDNPQSPVAWTGLYNLTQDVADVQIHFPDGTDQAKVLVRLKN